MEDHIRTDPPPRDTRMVERAREAVLESGDWLSPDEIARLAGTDKRHPCAHPGDWRERGHIFSIDHMGVELFPRYGLDPDSGFGPLEPLARIIGTFRGHKDGWGMAYWFHSDNGFLGGARPQDLLATEPGRVIEAALDEVRGISHG